MGDNVDKLRRTWERASNTHSGHNVCYLNPERYGIDRKNRSPQSKTSAAITLQINMTHIHCTSLQGTRAAGRQSTSKTTV